MSYIQSISGAFFKAQEHESSYVLLSNSGVVFLHKDSLEELSYITYTGIFTDLYTQASKSFIFLSTSGQGILRLDFDPEFITSGSLSVFKEYPTISNNIVNCIDGYEDVIVIGTASGVEVISGINVFSNYSISSITDLSITRGNGLYYTNQQSLYCKKLPINSNWLTNDYFLNSGTVPPIIGNLINEIDVLDTISGALVALATNSGITLYQEQSPISGSQYQNIEISGIINSVQLQKGSLINLGSIVFTSSGEGIKTTNLSTLNLEEVISSPPLLNINVRDFT